MKTHFVTTIFQETIRQMLLRMFQLIFGTLTLFSTAHAQDLCTQFGTTPVTRPAIVNGNSSTFGANLTDEVLEISGTFTVSGAFKFERCTLRMAADALIDVTTTSNFEMRDCRIFCCGQMWTGVRAVTDCRVVFWGNTIEDAFTAADITDPDHCQFHNNNFNSNDVSIRIRDYDAICSFGIAGNNFNQNWATLNEPSLITGLSDNSFAGFWITDCSSLVTKFGILLCLGPTI